MNGSSFKRMTLEELKKVRALFERGLKMAKEGVFDKIWAKSEPIDGQSQKEMFLERTEKALRLIDEELKRKSLELPN